MHKLYFPPLPCPTVGKERWSKQLCGAQLPDGLNHNTIIEKKKKKRN